ncbi:efflux RND transporter permease subunit [Deltaproteobacteria bacterium OttesenSCG-928-K17]|nr:efflux RND transporter permease subunit [Deltaproteobacteria bacterium OttesenSCG-928-K17]
MSISSAAVKRPVFTVMATLIVLTLGVFALGKIRIDLMPEMTYPVISVSTEYDNASPREVEELITKPLEQAVSAITGVEEIYSTSQEGRSQISIKFTWGQNLDEATNDIRDRVDRVIRRLPDEADRPLLRKFDTAASPIMFLGISSNLHPVKLKQFVEDEVVYRMERSPGVASASVAGGLTREIHVEVDPAKVKALNLDLSNFIALIKSENLTEAGGDIDRGRLQVMVRTQGEFTSLEELGMTVVAYGPGGALVRLRDIADVSDTWAKVTRITRVNRRDGLFMPVFKQSGSNTVEVADRANQSVDEINAALPNIQATPLFDSSVYIKQSLSSVTSSAVQGSVLALLVILVFLQNVRSTLILGTAIPISIIATFMCMFFGGLTLNVITLGALALGVGMLVDNAIVVLENIFRLRTQGLSPAEAAAEGAGEVTGAIVASTLTTLAVFMPMIFLEGMAGIMFRPFSWTITFALVSSLAVALTLVPMLSARLLGEKKTSGAVDSKGRPIKFGQPRYGRKYFKAVDTLYGVWLKKAVSRPKTVVALAFGAVFLSLIFMTQVGTEFLPKTDESSFRVRLTMEVGTRVEKTSEVMELIEAIVYEEVPEIRATQVSVGGGGGMGASGGSHTADLRVRLVPIEDRQRSVFEIMDSLRGKVGNIPGTTVRLRADQSFFSGGGSGDRIQIELRGNDFSESDRLSKIMKKLVEEVPGVTDVYLSNEDATPEELITIDRDRAADAHLHVSQISSLIKTALGGQDAGNYRDDGKEYSIVVKLKNGDRMSIDEIMNLTMTNAKGEQVVLRNVATAVSGSGPLAITRKDQARIVTISADYTDRALGEVIADIDAALATVPLPMDFSYSFAGDAKEQAETFAGLRNVLLLSIFLVYMVMACQFEQLKGPLVIMFSVPFAAIGVILSHFLTGTIFNINSFIGVIMLTGIVVNNAIILVDQANLLRRRDSLDMDDALIEAGRRRLRPILMTTLTTVLGLVPLSLGFGDGGETQAPLARAVIGGLSTSTFITLFVVPAIYKLLRPRIAALPKSRVRVFYSPE